MKGPSLHRSLPVRLRSAAALCILALTATAFAHKAPKVVSPIVDPTNDSKPLPIGKIQIIDVEDFRYELAHPERDMPIMLAAGARETVILTTSRLDPKEKATDGLAAFRIENLALENPADNSHCRKHPFRRHFVQSEADEHTARVYDTIHVVGLPATLQENGYACRYKFTIQYENKAFPAIDPHLQIGRGTN